MPFALEEYNERLRRLVAFMDERHPDWDSAFIVSKINLYYFCATMPDGALLIRKDGSRSLWIRASYERSSMESPLPEDEVHPMRSYRDIAAACGQDLGVCYAELESVPYALIKRIENYFSIAQLANVDPDIREVRSVKSEGEIDCIRTCGQLHLDLLEKTVPTLLREGMSEAEFNGELMRSMAIAGWQGTARFFRYGTEMPVGQMGFGVNSLFPTSFDGPGGNVGYGPAAPFGGHMDTILHAGDCVFVDVGFGIEGYHTDKTQVYCFGADPPPQALAAHQMCIEIQASAADRLKGGAIPAQIYEEAMASLSEEDKVDFMGYRNRQVKFLGHGVGLHVDEWPVIATGFDSPLINGMIIALEPKKGIEGFGMVGVEDTYLVSENGGVCLTGGGRGIIRV